MNNLSFLIKAVFGIGHQEVAELSQKHLEYVVRLTEKGYGLSRVPVYRKVQ